MALKPIIIIIINLILMPCILLTVKIIKLLFYEKLLLLFSNSVFVNPYS